jgi:uncharacterized protein with HEPN domain
MMLQKRRCHYMKKHPDRDPVLIKHIHKAISAIERYLIRKTFVDFQTNEILRDAVIRQLMIIGEASANLSAPFLEKYSDVPFHKIIGMRNRMVHGYWQVKDEIVWDACKSDLPELKEKLLSID